VHHVGFAILILRVISPRCSIEVSLLHCRMTKQQMHIDKHVQLHIIVFHQHVSVTLVTTIRVHCNMNIINLQLRTFSACLRLIPRFLSPYIFPSIPCFSRRFLRKMWPIHYPSLVIFYVPCLQILKSRNKEQVKGDHLAKQTACYPRNRKDIRDSKQI
jgi:hypothetical protein